MRTFRSRSERLTAIGGAVEVVPSVVNLYGPEAYGCLKHGCDVMLGAMVSEGPKFCDTFLTWEQARKMHADLGALIESHDKGAT